MSADEPARLVAVAWGTEVPPTRGPKRELTHSGIAAAAIAIADSEGIAAVTMQRVAESFGMTTMALYRYVSSKSELEQLMWNEALRPGDEFTVESEDWRQCLRGWAEQVRGRYTAHPWLIAIPTGPQSMVMPAHIGLTDRALRAMRALPLPDESKLAIASTLGLFVDGWASVAVPVLSAGNAEVGTVSPATARLVAEVVTPDQYPDLAATIQSGSYFPARSAEPTAGMLAGAAFSDPFEFGLELILDGVGALVAAGGEGLAGLRMDDNEDIDVAPANLEMRIPEF